MAKAPKRASEFTLVMVKTCPLKTESLQFNFTKEESLVTIDLWTAEELSCQEISNRFVTSNDSHFTMCTLTVVSLTLKRQLPCCRTERRNLQLAISELVPITAVVNYVLHPVKLPLIPSFPQPHSRARPSLGSGKFAWAVQTVAIDLRNS